MHHENPFDLISGLLFKDDFLEITVQGDCMAPVLTHGEKVIVRPARYPLREGNIYVYLYCNNWHVHRLFKLKDGTAQLIGDRSKTVEIVPTQAIIGEPTARNSAFSKKLICLVNYITLNHQNKLPDILSRLRTRTIVSILYIERWLYERKI